MNCPRCGTAISAGAQYCIRCGAPVATSAEAATQPAIAPWPASPVPPPAVRPRSTTRSRSDRWLILLAIGTLVVACLAFGCTLGACALWSTGTWLVAWAPVTTTPHIPPSRTPVKQTMPVSTATPAPTPTSPIPQPPEGRTVGYTAPDFTLPDLDDQAITLSTLRGTHVVLVDFWATWCGPCKQELPHIQDLYERYQDRGFTALVINVRESVNLAGGFIADQGYTFPVLLDREGAVLERYGVRGIPATFVVDTQGVIRQVQVGYRAGVEAELARTIESLLP